MVRNQQRNSIFFIILEKIDCILFIEFVLSSIILLFMLIGRANGRTCKHVHRMQSEHSLRWIIASESYFEVYGFGSSVVAEDGIAIEKD